MEDVYEFEYTVRITATKRKDLDAFFSEKDNSLDIMSYDVKKRCIIARTCYKTRDDKKFMNELTSIKNIDIRFELFINHKKFSFIKLITGKVEYGKPSTHVFIDSRITTCNVLDYLCFSELFKSRINYPLYETEMFEALSEVSDACRVFSSFSTPLKNRTTDGLIKEVRHFLNGKETSLSLFIYEILYKIPEDEINYLMKTISRFDYIQRYDDIINKSNLFTKDVLYKAWLNADLEILSNYVSAYFLDGIKLNTVNEEILQDKQIHSILKQILFGNASHISLHLCWIVLEEFDKSNDYKTLFLKYLELFGKDIYTINGHDYILNRFVYNNDTLMEILNDENNTQEDKKFIKQILLKCTLSEK